MTFMIDGADPLDDVVSEVERVYGVRLQLQDDTQDRAGGPRQGDIDTGGRVKQDRT